MKKYLLLFILSFNRVSAQQVEQIEKIFQNPQIIIQLEEGRLFLNKIFNHPSEDLRNYFSVNDSNESTVEPFVLLRDGGDSSDNPNIVGLHTRCFDIIVKIDTLVECDVFEILKNCSYNGGDNDNAESGVGGCDHLRVVNPKDLYILFPALKDLNGPINDPYMQNAQENYSLQVVNKTFIKKPNGSFEDLIKNKTLDRLQLEIQVQKEIKSSLMRINRLQPN